MHLLRQGFILRPEGPLSCLSPLGAWVRESMGGSGFGIRQTGPTSWETLGESAAPSGPPFPICKIEMILLGSDKVVIKFLVLCEATLKGFHL